MFYTDMVEVDLAVVVLRPELVDEAPVDPDGEGVDERRVDDRLVDQAAQQRRADVR